MKRILWILLHPVLMMTALVMIYTYFSFRDETMHDIFFRGLTASQQALMFSIVDSLIYGNWLYKVIAAIFIPNWLCLWFVQFANFNTKNCISFSKKDN